MDCILNGEKNDSYIESNINILKFVANAFSSKSTWLYYKENNE